MTPHWSEDADAAIRAWASGACYIDGRGNYRDKETRRVTSWNKGAKRAFRSTDDLYQACKVHPYAVAVEAERKRLEAAREAMKHRIYFSVTPQQAAASLARQQEAI